jgi:pyrroline-5-carboxylate reductase
LTASKLPSIGFIGAGQMARALAGGFVSAGLVKPENILAADPVAAAGQAFQAAVPGARLVADNASVVSGADIIFLATKPQQIEGAIGELAASVAGRLVVSIAAGVRLAKLATALPGARLVRVMPNTPCLVGQSASGYCLGPGATDADGQRVKQLLSAVGLAFEVDETLLDAVTGLSGSGPAFAYVMIEALADGGVRMGLKREVALALAAQTLKGAAQMVLETGEHPAVLKDRVASPGGTTIAGLEALEAGGLRGTLMAAVEAATRRSIELGQV